MVPPNESYSIGIPHLTTENMSQQKGRVCASRQTSIKKIVEHEPRAEQLINQRLMHENFRLK